MAFWQQQRNLHYTKGWGPCKRTKIFPLSEHYERQCPDGMTRFWDRRIEQAPGAFGPPGWYYGQGNMGHVGYVERGLGGSAWVPRDGRDPWNNRGVNELLDDVLARRLQDHEDRQAGWDRRAQEHRDRMGGYDANIRDIDGRLKDHLEAYFGRTDGPVSDAHLTMLKAEADVYADRGRQRADEQSRKDFDRLTTQRMEAIGRETARDMGRYGFVPVTPAWRGGYR